MRITDKVSIVTWIDAKVNVDGEIPPCPLMTSVGWIIHKDKNTTIIVSLKNESGEPRVTTVIPTSLVRNVKRVR